MKHISIVFVALLLLVPMVLWASDNGAAKVVWSASPGLQAASLDFASSDLSVVWSSSLLQADSFPDSIDQVKNVRANTDLDGDGKKEFIVPIRHIVDGVTRRSIFVFENAGDNSYSAVWGFTFDGAADQFVTVDVSDLDGDGNQEILAVHIPAGTANAPVLYAFEYTGTDNDYGTAPAVSWDLDTPVLDIVRVAKAWDLDGDGQQEVVLATFTTNPSFIIASVSDFAVPVWTKEVESDLGTTSPDIAAMTFSDMDADGTKEVVFTDGNTNKLYVVEATAADTYTTHSVGLPAGKSVSVHGMDVADANGDGNDEVYLANLQGNVYVVEAPGDAVALDSTDVHVLAETGEQWLEASTGSLGSSSFVIAASNATKAVDYRYVAGPNGDVTDPANYEVKTIVDSLAVEKLITGGIRVYGLDVGEDMDNDGFAEVIFTRGSTRGGHDAPAIFIAEAGIGTVATTALPDSIDQVKNIKANTDLDGDGKKEFIVPIRHIVDGVTRRSVFVFENSGDDSYDPVWSFTYDGAADQFVTVDVSDLDGDGNQEILAVHIPAGTDNAAVLYVFEYTGTDNDYGTAPAVSWDLDTPILDIVRVAKAWDLDGDGQQEVVLATFTTNPSLIIASVSDFTVPVWTKEVESDLGTTSPDIAALTFSDMDADGTKEVVFTDGNTNKLYVIEATAANTYTTHSVGLPASKSVSVHGMDVADANGDGRDEVYLANLQGNVYAISTTGDATALDSTDAHVIAETGEQWLEASTGSLGSSSFAIAASNATKAVDYRYNGGPGGDVTDAANFEAKVVVDSNAVENLVPGGIRVYGLDIGEDMDGDGQSEILFTRGSTRGGHNSPAIYIVEGALQPVKTEVDVTFWMNTATVPDTVSPNSIVQMRGDTAPLTWGDDTGGVFEHVDGDLWKVTLTFPVGAQVQYKFNVRTDLVLNADGGWESNVSNASTNRELTVPGADTDVPVQFFNTTQGNDQFFRPYTETGDLEVYLRVNMQGFANFNGDLQFVGTRGLWPEGGGDWSTPIQLTRETGSDNAGQFTYPANNFWSGVTRIAPGDGLAAGDTIKYKFVTLDASGNTLSWEDNISDRIFVVGENDATVVWDWFDGQEPIRASNEDTVVVTFSADMTRAIQARGFTPGDTLFARAGFSGTANELTDIPMLQIEGTSIWTGQDTLIATVGGIIEYDYRVTKFGVEQRESYFDFEFVPDSPAEQGRAERRRADLTGLQSSVVDDDPDEFSQRRQPFFPSNEVLAQDVTVTFEVDMRPAIFELLFSDPTDTLFAIQGGASRNVTDADSVLAWGVWINGTSTGGWQAWGGALEMDTTRIMYDDGTHGDAVAGDTIYTRQYLFSPDSLNIGDKGQVGQTFKFGIKGGDNEGGFGNNHEANVDDSQDTFTISAQFGSIDPKKYDHWDYVNRVPNPTSVELLDDLLPETFTLEQNYPNPFNPETAIQYAIPKGSDVKLTVYNLLGQKVATLVNEKQSAGNYLVKWNGQNDAGSLVSSGVYVYKLEVGDFVESRKMLLLK